MKRDKRLMQTTGLTSKINTLVILSLLLIMTCMVTTAQTTGGTITEPYSTQAGQGSMGLG